MASSAVNDIAATESVPVEEMASSEVNNTLLDLADFKGREPNDTEKKIIVDKGPVQPKGPFKKDPLQNKRSFSCSYYFSNTQYGKNPRFWLCYSEEMDAAHCQPCWLFSTKRLWCTGVRDWNHFSQLIKQHSDSNSHTNSCAIYEAWKKEKNINKQLQIKIKKEASFWKQVLVRIFDIILTFSKNCVALRGHNENLCLNFNHGNFLNTVQLIARYDHVLRQVLEMPEGSTRYLIPNIQNEVISCLGTELERSLLGKIKASPFFSVILDTTQDISKVDQLSVVVRYATIARTENGKSTKIEVKKVFLGFHAVSEHRADDLVNQVTKFFKEKKLDFKNCMGQGYDGTNVMSGVYNGVQKKIKDQTQNMCIAPVIT